MTSVEIVKSICKDRRIPISRLEKECGFANGYIGQLRKGTFPSDRLAKIAAYLDVEYQDLLFAENETADTLMSAANQMYGVEKEKPTAPEGSRLDAELMKRLMALTPDEEKQVDAFVQGLLASRKD